MFKSNVHIREINPIKMRSDDSFILGRFLKMNKDKKYFKKGVMYQLSYQDDMKGFVTIHFKLTHDLVWRQRKIKNTGDRYEIKDKQLAKGGFSQIYSSIGNLEPKEDGRVCLDVKPREKKRIIKMQMHSYKCPKSMAKKEFNLSNKISRLHIKSPTFINKHEDNVLGPISFIVMRQLMGNVLADITSTDNLYYLTKNECFAITNTLLVALKEVHDKGIVHRDLNPRNILIKKNFMKLPDINIIDFGMSKEVSRKDAGEIQGTLGYVAPEVYRGVGTTFKSDVFSMGKIINKVWNRVNDIDLTLKKALDEIIFAMTADDENNRLSLDEVIEKFNQLPGNKPINANSSEKNRKKFQFFSCFPQSHPNVNKNQNCSKYLFYI